MMGIQSWNKKEVEVATNLSQSEANFHRLVNNLRRQNRLNDAISIAI